MLRYRRRGGVASWGDGPRRRLAVPCDHISVLRRGGV